MKLPKWIIRAIKALAAQVQRRPTIIFTFLIWSNIISYVVARFLTHRSQANQQYFADVVHTARWYLPAIVLTIVTGPELIRKPLIQAQVLAFVFATVLIVSPTLVYAIEYYNAVAQLLPVVFLAFIIEQKPHFQRADHQPYRWATVGVTVAQFYAGYSTFKVLAYKDTTLGDPAIINAAIATTLVLLTISLITPLPEPKPPKPAQPVTIQIKTPPHLEPAPAPVAPSPRNSHTPRSVGIRARPYSRRFTR
jgi:hypothetical protein